MSTPSVHSLRRRRLVGWLWPAVMLLGAPLLLAAPCVPPTPVVPGWAAPLNITFASQLVSRIVETQPRIALTAVGDIAIAYRSFHTELPPPGAAPGPIYWARVYRYDACLNSAATTTLGRAAKTDKYAPDSQDPGGMELAADDQSNLIVAWAKYSETGAKPIAVHRLTPTSGWDSGQDVVANALSAGAPSDLYLSNRFRIGMDGAGNAMLAWIDFTSVHAKRYQPNSGWAAASTLLSASSSGTHMNLAAGKSGAVFLTWADFGSSSIESRQYSVGAWTFNSWPWTLSFPLGRDSRLAADNTGGALAVIAAGAAMSQTVRHSNSTWGTPVALKGFGLPSGIAVNGAGNAVAVSRISTAIFASRYTASVGTWATAQALATLSSTAGEAGVAIDDAGNSIAIWTDANKLWMSRYSVRCVPPLTACGWSSPSQLSQGNDPVVGEPAIAMWPSGRAVAVWRQGASVYLRRYYN
jgi:hypothetical protein